MQFTIPQAHLKCDGGDALDAEAASDVLQDLEQHDALYVTEGSNFEDVQALVRAFPALGTLQRATLCDVLCANLSSLGDSISSLLGDWGAAAAEAVTQHKSALNMHVYLLHGLAMAAQQEAEAQREEQQRQQSKSVTGKPRGKQAQRAAGGGFRWEGAQLELLRCLQALLLLDLPTLYKGLTALERVVLLALDLAMQAAMDPSSAKVPSVRETCIDLLCLVAIKYGQLEDVAAALFRLAGGQEHGPELVAAVVKQAEGQHNNSQLAVALVTQFASVAPGEYQPSSSTAKHAGQLLALLAEVAPRAVNSQLSQLQPYLACKAATIRAGLVSAVGSVLEQLYQMDAVSAAAPAGAVQAHARSKEHLLSLLSARLLDKDSYVRQRTLHTWGALVATPVVPLPMWNLLLNLAIGRLEDSSSKVVKAALQLVFSMVHHSPFGPKLSPSAFAATLQQQEQLLAEMAPEEAEDGEGQLWQGGTVQVDKDTPPEEDGAEQAAAVPASPAPPTPQRTDPAFDSKLQRLRATVASLREALGFASRLEALMPQLGQLLCYPSTDVVQNTIALLTFCERFQVPGSAAALRAMWPLIFSKDEPVKKAVLDSWHKLFLEGRPPAAQVELLLSQLLPNSTLAELTALEAIFQALAAADSSSGGEVVLLGVGGLLHQVLVQACRCYQQLKEVAGGAGDAHVEGAADGDQGPGPQALLGRLRSCYTLINLLAAADPAQVATQWDVVLEGGFSASVQDAWVMTQCANALSHMAPHLPRSSATLLHLSQAGATTPTSNTPPTPQDAACCSKALQKLLRVLVAPPGPQLAANWPAVAQAAVGAVYRLHPHPHQLMAAVLQQLAQLAATSLGSSKAASCGCMARFFHLVGLTAVQQLLLTERLTKALARRTAAGAGSATSTTTNSSAAQPAAAAAEGAGKARGKGKAGAGDGAGAAAAAEEEDIGKQLGVGGSDIALDMLTQQVELQILESGALLGRYGRLLSGFCSSKALLGAPQELQGAALLGLTHLMAVDMTYCADNVALVFTLLVQRLVPPEVRCNLVTALADLASRWPNVLEPWTPHLYTPLTDSDPAVKRCALTVLTHLVLGGVVKAKGHVAKVALLLEDEDLDIKSRALLFFDSLARSGTGSARSSASAVAGGSASNPVYNLLPDMLSALVREPGLREEQFRGIMSVLLQKEYVKEKQADALRDKLAMRMEAPGAGPREWRCLAWCIQQLGYSEKGVRGLMELTRHYKQALGEPQVWEVFKELCEKAKRSGGGSKAAAAAAAGGGSGPGDLRERAEEWEKELMAGREAALEQQAVEAAAARRQQQREEQEGGGATVGEEQGGQEEGESGGGVSRVVEVGGTASKGRRRSSRGAGAAGGGDGGVAEGDKEMAEAQEGASQADLGAGEEMEEEAVEEEEEEAEEEEECIAVMSSQLPQAEVPAQDADSAADLAADLDGLQLAAGGGSKGAARRAAGKASSSRQSAARGGRSAASSRRPPGKAAGGGRGRRGESEGVSSATDSDSEDAGSSDASSEDEEVEEEVTATQQQRKGGRAAASSRTSAAAATAAAQPAAQGRSGRSSGNSSSSSSRRQAAANGAGSQPVAAGAAGAGGRRRQVWVEESSEEGSE